MCWLLSAFVCMTGRIFFLPFHFFKIIFCVVVMTTSVTAAMDLHGSKKEDPVEVILLLTFTAALHSTIRTTYVRKYIHPKRHHDDQT